MRFIAQRMFLVVFYGLCYYIVIEHGQRERSEMVEKLTQNLITDLEPSDKMYEVRDYVITGLSVRVFPSGVKTYSLCYFDTWLQKRFTKKIGRCDVLSLSDVRERCKEVLKKAALGDPNPWGVETPKDRITLGELVHSHYEPWVLVNRRSGPKTVGILKRGFGVFWDMPLGEITLLKIEKEIQNKKNTGEVKTSTINRQTAALKALFHWAKDRDLVATNPTEKLALLQEIDVEEKTRYLVGDEYSRLIQILDERDERLRSKRITGRQKLDPSITRIRVGKYADYLKPLVLVAINTGIRFGALTKILQTDVNFDKRLIYLTRLTAKGFKTQYIVMNEIVFEVLSEWIKQIAGLSPYLFPSPKNFDKPVSCIKTAWKGVLKKAGIKDFRFHDLRHDFASQLVMRDIDLYTVAELLGHSDIRITKRYAHLSPAYIKSAVSKLEDR